ncbi:phosphatidylglycerol lysyltransferase domain-containing protein [Profundibacter amoris]|uniref:DUF2156 domain-containing protein n=1 Tax=Profundibacter amoris TaxID=2171755 RepID=A0A347UGU5_9RHOB|nr:phosphatidylglycerol lysyltransferase domain-containing protein [Profundibacter amoris]AXX98073.1 DUF2156 domain-containing protein [Profundibacter amoris]
MNELSEIRLGKEFEQQTYSRIVAIGYDDLPLLQRVLNFSKSDDPYQKSAAYFAMTGRNGLWMARDENTAIIYCRHPNLEDYFLVFPTIGQESDELLTEALGAIVSSGGVPIYARAEGLLPEDKINPNFNAQKIPEKHLDWAYPVCTLDTKLVGQHRGNKFQQLRTALNKLDHTRVLAIDFDPSQHRGDIFEVLEQWASNEKGKSEPYQRLLELFDILPMQGRLIYHDGKPAGFSIWEETDPRNGMANAHAHIGIHQVSGLSRFVMLDMCQALEARGFGRVCIGGSETSGLNQFKQQMRPVESIELSSYRITPKSRLFRNLANEFQVLGI